MIDVRQARLSQTGWDDDLVIEAGELPAPQGDQLLVDVAACGVCHRDLIDREGRIPFMRLPVTPGHEAVGRVRQAGPDVRELAVGDRVATMHRDHCGDCPACQRGDVSLCSAAAWVLGLLADGGYASALLAPERCLFRVPESLADSQAAVMHCTFGTAFRGLTRGGTELAGGRVLITGANGGVGSAAIQVAKRLGAHVTAVTRQERHAPWLRQLGADEICVDPGNGFHKRIGQQVDVVLECVGQPTFNAALRSLRIGGRLVVVGNVVAQKAALNLGYLITFGSEVVGSSGATPADMDRVFALHEAEPFQVTIDRELGIDQADEAQRLLKRGGVAGRIVLKP